MEVKEIIYDGEVVARHIPVEAWADGLGFYSKDEEFIQVGTWKYDKGKNLLRHIHNEVNRNVSRTQEVLFIINGSLKANIFSLDKQLVAVLIIKKGDTLILLNCGHGYEILEDSTQVLEIKNGPYLGTEVDRERF